MKCVSDVPVNPSRALAMGVRRLVVVVVTAFATSSHDFAAGEPRDRVFSVQRPSERPP
jgi:hypothetical protein